MSISERIAPQSETPDREPDGAARSWPTVRTGHDTPRQATGYRIVWEHRDTGRVVVGQYTYASHEVAKAVADAMDSLWPAIRHRPISARDAVKAPPGA
jgi:hypothetical protein